MAKTIKPIKTLDIETFSQLNHLHIFSGSSFSFPSSSSSMPSTDPNAMRDKCGISSTRGLTRKDLKRSRSYGVGDFPPPISCIGKCGKPFVSFRSFRQDGRFILKEIRIPELLHVQRENGRLKLQFIQSDDDDDEEEDGDDDDDGAIDEDGKVERFEKITMKRK